MKTQYIAEMAEGTKVDTTFSIASKEMKAARTGDAYLTFEFSDRTGRIHGVLFRPGAVACALPVGSVAVVRGTVTTFRGLKRLSVEDVRPADSYDSEDLLPSGTRSSDEMLAELRRLAAGVVDRDLRRLLRVVFSDAGFLDRFARCPASQSYHHPYLGGLMEHTVAVANLCSELAPSYPAADADLLVTAALLHDVGKVDELSFDTSIDYTDAGRLLGHVVLGTQRVHQAASDLPRFDSRTLMKLEHAMLSHHGELEWGSPKRPSTIEALLLHHADNLDAKAAGFSALLAGASAAQEAWTDSGNLFRRPLYAPRAAEDDRDVPAEEDRQYHRLSA